MFREAAGFVTREQYEKDLNKPTGLFQGIKALSGLIDHMVSTVALIEAKHDR